MPHTSTTQTDATQTETTQTETTVFIKLGGSLITDKRTPETPRRDVIARLAHELATVRAVQPHLRILLGHGSGSFGHVYGQRYGTRHGARTPNEWFGFAVTADAAARLNRVVIGELLAVGVPAWAIQPSATLRCADGVIVAGPEAAIREAFGRGVQPVIFGDVALDSVRGATIAGTEEQFHWLTPILRPTLVILLGEVDGIYTADPLRNPDAIPIPDLTPTTLADFAAGLGESHGVDVTGGMAAKVNESLAMIRANPGLEVVVCSGLIAGHLEAVLSGSRRHGTWIHA